MMLYSLYTTWKEFSRQREIGAVEPFLRFVTGNQENHQNLLVPLQQENQRTLVDERVIRQVAAEIVREFGNQFSDVRVHRPRPLECASQRPQQAQEERSSGQPQRRLCILCEEINAEVNVWDCASISLMIAVKCRSPLIPAVTKTVAWGAPPKSKRGTTAAPSAGPRLITSCP